jgi:hypothetical protein
MGEYVEIVKASSTPQSHTSFLEYLPTEARNPFALILTATPPCGHIVSQAKGSDWSLSAINRDPQVQQYDSATNATHPAEHEIVSSLLDPSVHGTRLRAPHTSEDPGPFYIQRVFTALQVAWNIIQRNLDILEENEWKPPSSSEAAVHNKKQLEKVTSFYFMGFMRFVSMIETAYRYVKSAKDQNEQTSALIQTLDWIHDFHCEA